jgi:carbon-monoxide dehydrogenase large subunit
VTADAQSGLATRLIGAHVKRLEDPHLLTGQGRYLDDLRLPDLLHAAFVRSPHAHARVLGVDVSPARGAAGVVAALAGRDLAGRVGPLAPRLEADGFVATAWPALADSRVRFVGEPVAVVAAASPYAAADGSERVVASYEPLAAVTDVDAALAPGSPLSFTRPRAGQHALPPAVSWGDVEAPSPARSRPHP